MRALVTALTTIRRSPYQALTSILMVSVTFMVAYSFSMLLMGANAVLQHFETQPQIIAFFEVDAPQDDINAVEAELKQKPYVKDVTFVSKEAALKIYQESNKDQPLLLELVTADILPASLEVSALDISSLPQIKTDLEAMPSVDEVDFQENVISELGRWTNNLRLIGLAAVITLGVISFLIITIIIAMKANSQKMAITIMRLIGATSGYIKAPFMVEGIVYGVTGSLIGWIASYAALLYLSPWIRDFLGDINLLPVSNNILAMQLGIGVLAGLILGGFAGLLAVSRFTRR
jgi:cell division transport system permease protein